jgi:hypothetical protein
MAHIGDNAVHYSNLAKRRERQKMIRRYNGRSAHVSRSSAGEPNAATPLLSDSQSHEDDIADYFFSSKDSDAPKRD